MSDTDNKAPREHCKDCANLSAVQQFGLCPKHSAKHWENEAKSISQAALTVADELDKLQSRLEKCEGLLRASNERHKYDFHQRVCCQSMGCHCSETAIDKYFAEVEK